VDVTPDGEAIAVWTQTGIRAVRHTEALGWGAPVLIDNGGVGASGARVAVDPSGNATAVWAQDGMIWANRQVASAAWGTPAAFGGTGFSPIVDVDFSGNAVATWVVNDSDGSTDVWTNRFIAGAGWAGREELQDSRTPGGVVQHAAALAPRGTAVAVWSQIGPPQNINASVFR
jgi:hypothetical protein